MLLWILAFYNTLDDTSIFFKWSKFYVNRDVFLNKVTISEKNISTRLCHCQTPNCPLAVKMTCHKLYSCCWCHYNRSAWVRVCVSNSKNTLPLQPCQFSRSLGQCNIKFLLSSFYLGFILALKILCSCQLSPIRYNSVVLRLELLFVLWHVVKSWPCCGEKWKSCNLVSPPKPVFLRQWVAKPNRLRNLCIPYVIRPVTRLQF